MIFVKCAIPVFDGLLPEPHNRAVTELLFALAHWHALAKLRMHNDLTLEIMDAATVSLGKKLREFTQKTCPAFETKELSREYNARMRRQAKAASSTHTRKRTDESSNNDQVILGSEISAGTSDSIGMNNSNSSEAATDPSSARIAIRRGRRRKILNLNTFKGHSLGDYANTIRVYGTTDSFSTEAVRDPYLFNLPSLTFNLRVNWNTAHRNQDLPAQAVRVLSSSLHK
jgi:hypothetical protein